jgi:hypothetical protein
VQKVAEKENELQTCNYDDYPEAVPSREIEPQTWAMRARMSSQHSIDELTDLNKRWRDIVNLSGNLLLDEGDYSSGIQAVSAAEITIPSANRNKATEVCTMD